MNRATPRNPVAFFERVGRIDGKPIRLYPYQKKLLLDPGRFRMINKSRQVGISWAIGLKALHKAMIDPRTRYGYVASAEKQGVEWLEEVRAVWAELPRPWRMPLRSDKKTKIAFEGGGSIEIRATSASSIRSGRWTDLLLDEFAHVYEDRSIINAALPKISRSKTGSLDIVSTPLGQRGMFYEMWTDDAYRELFKRFEIPWHECPDLNESIIQLARRTLGEDGYAQEYECSFLDETASYFPYDLFLANQRDIEVYEFAPAPDVRLLWPASVHDDHWKAQVAELAADIREACPELVDGWPLFGGFDVGRTTDTSEVYLVREEGDLLPERFRVTLKRVNFTHQRFFLAALMEALPVQMICVDQTGIGRDIAEYLQTEYPARVEPVHFSAELKEDLVTTAKGLLQDRRTPVDHDRTLMLQARTIKRVAGQTKMLFKVDRSEARGHHADRFWAWTLALRAATKAHGYQPALATVSTW
jgi:phage FluMu gp28-like protein